MANLTCPYPKCWILYVSFEHLKKKTQYHIDITSIFLPIKIKLDTSKLITLEYTAHQSLTLDQFPRKHFAHNNN
jgi:hypothetical protein